MWCAKWKIKLYPEKKEDDHILQVHTHQENRTQSEAVWRDIKSLFSSEISKYYFRLPTHFQEALRGHPGPLQYQVPPFKAISQQKVELSPSTFFHIIKTASDQFLNTALFQRLSARTIPSAKFNGSKTKLFGLPSVYQNTPVLSCSMTPLAFHM